VITVRDAIGPDHPALWALNDLPFKGPTANPSVPLALPPAPGPPAGFPDLADVERSFAAVGGHFVMAEHEGHVVGMGGIRPSSATRVDVLRVRVHPAVRRQGIGALVMAELERRAGADGFAELFLDTTPEQPEAIAFYEALGYREVGRETRPEWHWTLVYFLKTL
jgi:ribosomal protein S18 acetylase RimI-like enzyme